VALLFESNYGRIETDEAGTAALSTHRLNRTMVGLKHGFPDAICSDITEFESNYGRIETMHREER